MDKYRVGESVKLHTSDEWNDLYGVVDEVFENVVAVFCTKIPWRKYYLTLTEAETCLERLDD